MSEVVSRTADAGGISTHYLEAGSGPPLILIHGGGAGADSRSNWLATISVFASRFRVIAMDMVGFGDTAKPDFTVFTYSQQARIEHLRSFLDALDIRRASFIGNSMGGATALGFASENPERVERLILMGSAGLNTELHPDLMPIINYDFTREGMLRLIRALTNENFQPSPDLIDYRLKNSLKPDTRAAYAATMKWIRDQGGLFYDPDFIARVACPTMVVNGKNDKVVPLSNAYRFLELIPNSWGFIIPHCGHWAMVERPNEFARASLNFLEAA